MSNSKTLQYSVSRFCNCVEAQVLYYVDRIQKQKMSERTIGHKIQSPLLPITSLEELGQTLSGKPQSALWYF